MNFGIVYGISAYSLSKDIGVTVSEADRYIKNYLRGGSMGLPPVLAGLGVHLHGDGQAGGGLHLLLHQRADL